MGIYRLKNEIKNYSWGSEDLLFKYFGIENPQKRPQAEMWMGAHPGAPSQLIGLDKDLLTFIRESPEKTLGEYCAKKFNGELPFLFKILSAKVPLSIQAHPDKTQAKNGFDRENESGIALNDPNRNYKDNNHKPEIICALSEFWAMNGFRPPKEINENFKILAPGVLPELTKNLLSDNDYKTFFLKLMTIDKGAAKQALNSAIAWAENASSDEARWILEISGLYPDDIAVLSPLYLNLVKLKSGQAMYLGAGRLHAYLSGIGVELMANSDNVLRGGLTNKHMDIQELSRVLKFESSAVNIILPSLSESEDFEEYVVPGDEFNLKYLDSHYFSTSLNEKGPQILLCQNGEAILKEGDKVIEINSGVSVFISPSENNISMAGNGKYFMAGVPV